MSEKIKSVTVFLEGEKGGMVYPDPVIEVEVIGESSFLIVGIKLPTGQNQANVFNLAFVRAHIIEYYHEEEER